RATSSPPQLGHLPLRMPSAQSRQNVHSNEQMSASGASAGKSRSQHSQLGRSWSMGFLRYPQQRVEAWTGGHFTVPKEQKTQQSPLFGLSRRLHPRHSWK